MFGVRVNAMKVKYQDSITYKMLERLAKMPAKVILRADFDGLGDIRQITRGLTALIKQNRLVRIGSGVYAKAYRSTIDPKRTLIEGGADIAFRETLDRLGVNWEPGSSEQMYNARQTTQIPARNIVRLKSRFRRKISYQKKQLIYEDKINAR